MNIEHSLSLLIKAVDDYSKPADRIIAKQKEILRQQESIDRQVAYAASRGDTDKAAAISAAGADKIAALKLDQTAAKTELLSKKFLSLGVAIDAGFGLAVKAAASFDQHMSDVKAVVEGSSAQFEALRTEALNAGHAFGLTANQVASAEAALGGAGLSASEILGGALKGTLALAAAGQLDFASATNIAVQTLHVFGLAASDTSHVADVLVAAGTKSAESVQDVADGLAKAAAVAQGSKIPFEDTTALLALFAQNGLKGADGGTAMVQFLTKLTPTAKVAAGAMKDLNLNFFNDDGSFKGIANAFQELHDKLGPLPDDIRQTAEETLFGRRAIKVADIAVREGAAGIQQYIQAVNDQGVAARIANERLDNLGGSLKRLQSTLSSALAQGGEGGAVGLKVIVDGLDGMVRSFTALPPVAQKGIVTIGGIAGVAATAVGATGLLVLKLEKASTALIEVGGAARVAGLGLGFLADAAPYAAVLGALAVGASLLYGAFHHGQSQGDVKALAQDLVTLGDSGKVVGHLAEEFGAKFEKLGVALQTLRDESKIKLDISGLEHQQGATTDGLGSAFFARQAAIANLKKQLIDAKGATKDLDSALADVVKNGGKAAGSASLDYAAKQLGVTRQELIDQLPQYQAEVKNATTAEEISAIAQKASAAADREKAESLGILDGKLTGHNDLVDNLSDATFKKVKADEAYKDAEAGVTKAVSAQTTAQAELAKFLKAGKVDQEKVTEATKQYTEAQHALLQAQEQVTAAQADLDKALEKASADEVTAAIDKVTSALLDQKDANKKLQDAIAARDAAQKAHASGSLLGVTADEVAVAKSNVSDKFTQFQKATNEQASQTDITKAHKDWIDAQTALNDLLDKGTVSDQDLADANDAVTRATIDADSATQNLHDSEKARQDTFNKGSESDQNVVTARQHLRDANWQAEAATTALSIAEAAKRTAEAGDPDFEEKKREKIQAVADATTGVNKANEMLTDSAEARRKAINDEKDAYKDNGNMVGYLWQQLTKLQKDFPDIGNTPFFKSILQEVQDQVAAQGLQISFSTAPINTAPPGPVKSSGPGLPSIRNGVAPAAIGGIVDRATLLLAGEAGAEAVVPKDKVSNRVWQALQAELGNVSSHPKLSLDEIQKRYGAQIHAASGGIFPARPGGFDVNLAEGGEAEVVAPLSQLKKMVAPDPKLADRIGALERLTSDWLARLKPYQPPTADLGGLRRLVDAVAKPRELVGAAVGPPRTGDIHVEVHVAGSVTADQELAQTIYTQLLRLQRRNGTTGLR